MTYKRIILSLILVMMTPGLHFHTQTFIQFLSGPRYNSATLMSWLVCTQAVFPFSFSEEAKIRPENLWTIFLPASAVQSISSQLWFQPSNILGHDLMRVDGCNESEWSSTISEDVWKGTCPTFCILTCGSVSNVVVSEDENSVFKSHLELLSVKVFL